jgi:hypothetical protein
MLLKDLYAMKKQFKGLILERPGREARVTKEGVVAVEEAIAFLKY